MTEANWNHLIDVAAQVIEYLVAPVILAVMTWIGIWVKHKIDQRIAIDLAEKTNKVVQDNKTINEEIKAEVAEIKQQTNGMMAVVTNAAKASGMAAGFAAGVKSEIDKKQ